MKEMYQRTTNHDIKLTVIMLSPSKQIKRMRLLTVRGHDGSSTHTQQEVHKVTDLSTPHPPPYIPVVTLAASHSIDRGAT